jgi:hypothetical protein
MRAERRPSPGARTAKTPGALGASKTSCAIHIAAPEDGRAPLP